MELKLATTFLDIVNKSISLFDTVKKKLVNQPEEASGKLEAVLEELLKTPQALSKEISGFLSLTIDKDNLQKEDRKLLFELEDGFEFNHRLNQARGHCGKIKNIYYKYLDKWFSKVLSPDESGDMASLFEKMEDADSGMLGAIYEVGNLLSSMAKEILVLVDEDNFSEANSRLKAFKDELRPLRTLFSDAAGELQTLANEFAAVTGAV